MKTDTLLYVADWHLMKLAPIGFLARWCKSRREMTSGSEMNTANLSPMGEKSSNFQYREPTTNCVLHKSLSPSPGELY
jgi:hypothetical protein